MGLESFNNWLPISFSRKDGRIFADWCFLYQKKFVESFHEGTLQKLMFAPFNQLFRRQTPIDFLGELYEKRPGLAPKGFIFHLSRCGSTLVSQMLSAVPKNIVISEAQTIDRIIRADTYFSNVTREQKILWLRWLFNVLAQKRFPEEENFFVKFDSWSIIDFSLIAEAFPEVPWIFIYRDPIEVMVSLYRQPSAQMISGVSDYIFPNMDLNEAYFWTIEERCARTLSAFCHSALENASSSACLLINYSQLPAVVTTEILEHFQVEFTDEELEKMRNQAAFNAKAPQAKFISDRAEKRRAASETIVFYAQKFVDPLYEQLEDLRMSKAKVFSTP